MKATISLSGDRRASPIFHYTSQKKLNSAFWLTRARVADVVVLATEAEVVERLDELEVLLLVVLELTLPDSVAMAALHCAGSGSALVLSLSLSLSPNPLFLIFSLSLARARYLVKKRCVL